MLRRQNRETLCAGSADVLCVSRTGGYTHLLKLIRARSSVGGIVSSGTEKNRVPLKKYLQVSEIKAQSKARKKRHAASFRHQNGSLRDSKKPSEEEDTCMSNEEEDTCMS